jgi:hypothetical protein
MEIGKEPMNVQVVVGGAVAGPVCLRDNEGVFLEAAGT